MTLKTTSSLLILLLNRDVATLGGRGGGQGAMVPHFNFQTKQGPTVSVSNRDISFYGCLEIIPTRNMTIFTLSVTIFGQFTGAFHFSNYIGEIDHFSLDF